MFSSRNGQWYPLLATLDTETTESWISRSIVDRLGLDVTNDRTTIGTTVNGKQLSSGSIVTPTWCSMGRGITHVTVFRVVNNGPCDVLFGRNILFSPEINFFVEERGCNPILPITTPSPDVSRFFFSSELSWANFYLARQRSRRRLKNVKSSSRPNRQTLNLPTGR